MDPKFILAVYILPGLSVVFGIPLALGLIPPNRFYGYRTRKTFSSAEVWYRANRFSGWCMVIAGILAFCHNAWFQHSQVHLPPATQHLFMTISTGLLVFLGLILSAFYVRKL